MHSKSICHTFSRKFNKFVQGEKNYKALYKRETKRQANRYTGQYVYVRISKERHERNFKHAKYSLGNFIFIKLKKPMNVEPSFTSIRILDKDQRNNSREELEPLILCLHLKR